MAFEQHVLAARARRGAEVPAEWYDGPTFYYSNPWNLVRHGEPVRRPSWTRRLDFELEIACIIGTAGVDIAAADAEQHIAGYTIFNDWSARDAQRREMAVGLGPSKSKEFANSLGPVIVGPEELAERRCAPGRYDLAMVARINGRELSRGNARDMRWSFAELVEHASRDCPLVPGDVIGSGTVGSGCLLELGQDPSSGGHPWLEPGDEVELEIERIGVLRNRVGS